MRLKPKNPGARPTMVLAEDSPWEFGVDFGCALRKRGLRFVRLLSAESSSPEFARRRKLTSLLCDLSVLNSFPTPDELSAPAREQLRSDAVVDVQCLEMVLNVVHRETTGRVRPPVDRLTLADAVDKVAVDTFLAAQGVPALTTVGSPDEIEPGASGPFIVKQRSGAGGGGAIRCEDLAEVRAVFDRQPPGTLLVQPFIQGRVLDSAGVARNGKVVQAATYNNVVSPQLPYGGARAIIIEDIPDLLELTERVVAAMGINGPFAIDAVRHPDGHLSVIDVNLRIFGCWAALQDAGLDVIGSYLYSIGLGPDPGPVELAPGGRFALIRFDEDLSTWEETPGQWLASYLRVIYARRRFLGTRWAVITASRIGLQVAEQVRPGRRGSAGDSHE